MPEMKRKLPALLAANTRQRVRLTLCLRVKISILVEASAMIIFIDKIDSKLFLPLGYTNLPSFVVQFGSACFDGVARFVPASGLHLDCAGHEFGVEIGQESVTDFQIVVGGAVPAIEPLDKAGSSECAAKCGEFQGLQGADNDCGGA